MREATTLPAQSTVSANGSQIFKGDFTQIVPKAQKKEKSDERKQHATSLENPLPKGKVDMNGGAPKEKCGEEGELDHNV